MRCVRILRRGVTLCVRVCKRLAAPLGVAWWHDVCDRLSWAATPRWLVAFLVLTTPRAAATFFCFQVHFLAQKMRQLLLAEGVQIYWLTPMGRQGRAPRPWRPPLGAWGCIVAHITMQRGHPFKPMVLRSPERGIEMIEWFAADL